jgi:hypothetical protein
MEFLVHVGFVDGTRHHTRKLSSTMWVIYSQEGQVVLSEGACLGPTINNMAKFSIVTELLRDGISHGISCLEVFLDS